MPQLARLIALSFVLSAGYLSATHLGADPGSQVEAADYQDLRYRLLGPFRAGRTVGAVGIPTQPNVFFVGVNNGGVWKTDDFGRTWRPIFDAAPTGSVGDLAVSPNHPEVIYVGTGEGLHRPDLSVGDGIFKSTDGGVTWRHAGLADVQQVARLVVHPTDPDIVFVAGLGHPYGPNEERGVFRTHDGGETWDQILYIDENTGAIQVELDPTDARTVYASMWEHREGPWENASFTGGNSGLYKSTDGGSTWQRIGAGLPTADQGLGRIGIGIAPRDPARLYATVEADGEYGGVYRSDDGGESWRQVTTDHRIWGRADDFGEIRVHPENPDVVFSGNIASYRSEDGGRTWTSFKGAPGGDDYHRIWINPLDPDIMLLAADQGATITVNGGRTWSSWYNQPTAQLYHVTTTRNRFPYEVCGGQQESGAICIASRGNGGQISFREWQGIGADEYAYVAPDPNNPYIVYGGRVMRFDRRTGQAQNVAPEALRSGAYRILRTMPLLFHPADPERLLFATNVLWETANGGQDWRVISPDLTREQPAVPASVGAFETPEMATMPRRGVIYAVAPSALDVGTIWAGTDDGLVHLTRDGGAHWTGVTPPELRPWDKVSQIDAGHFDVDTAYLAINAIRRDDMRPHIYRTHDGGQSWTRIVAGLDQVGPVNVVREDPKQPGLLFAGTERTIYFSVDDGDHWYSLRQNLPPSSMRDLVVHDDDLVVGTHGRSIWVLDNIAPLRQLSAAIATGDPYLVAPPTALRVRWNMFSDTPLPPEVPGGENPPDGAILDYWLPSTADLVTLEVVDARGTVVRRYSSADPAEAIDPDTLPHPTYWIRPPQALGTGRGHHRFVWDLHREPPPGTKRQFSIAAVFMRTPSGPYGPFVPPGHFMVRLTVDGRTLEQPLAVELDPRVDIDPESLAQQTDFSLRCYYGYLKAQEIRENIERELESATGDRRAALESLRGEGKPGLPDAMYGAITAASAAEETVVDLQDKLLWVLYVLQDADARPTTAARSAVTQLEASLGHILERWEALR